MGGLKGPSVSRSPGTAPQKRAGQPMGPLHPALFTSKLLGFDVSLGMFRPQRFLFGSLASGFCL